jgi:hypothetical protein
VVRIAARARIGKEGVMTGPQQSADHLATARISDAPGIAVDGSGHAFHRE